jgi:hypothetical protein
LFLERRDVIGRETWQKGGGRSDNMVDDVGSRVGKRMKREELGGGGAESGLLMEASGCLGMGSQCAPKGLIEYIDRKTNSKLDHLAY